MRWVIIAATCVLLAGCLATVGPILAGVAAATPRLEKRLHRHTIEP